MHYVVAIKTVRILREAKTKLARNQVEEKPETWWLTKLKHSGPKLDPTGPQGKVWCLQSARDRKWRAELCRDGRFSQADHRCHHVVRDCVSLCGFPAEPVFPLRTYKLHSSIRCQN